MTIWTLVLYSHYEVVLTRHFRTQGQAYKALMGSLSPDEYDHFDRYWIGPDLVEGM